MPWVFEGAVAAASMGMGCGTCCGSGISAILFGYLTTHARNFAPLYDIDEEAATGTSTGAMTYYLYLNGVIGSDEQCKFIQGEKMARPSAIRSEIHANEKRCDIKVGGSAVVLAEGEINI